MTDTLLKSYVFGENDSIKLEICYDELAIHPWLNMDMAGQLDQLGENSGWLPDNHARHFGRGNKDAVGFTRPEEVQVWLDDLRANGKWGVAFGIYCFNDCNNTMRLYRDVDWTDTNCDLVLYIDSDSYEKWVGDGPNIHTDKERMEHARHILSGEFKLFESYFGGGCMYGALSRKCSHCDSWVLEGSIGGYYGDRDDIELAERILDSFEELETLTPAERESFTAKFINAAV